MLKEYKLVKEEFGKDHVFVLGNTKYLKDFTDADAEVLFKNGDARIAKVEETTVESTPKKVKSLPNVAATNE